MEHEGALPLPSADEREKVHIPEVAAGGYEVPSYRPPVWVSPEDIPGPTNSRAEAQSTVSHGGPPVQAVESSIGKESTDGADIPGTHTKAAAAERPTMERHHSVREVMTPHLQFMAGPMLVYHTVADDVWHGAGASLCDSTRPRTLTPLPLAPIRQRSSSLLTPVRSTNLRRR
jgi:hypothetical protein